MRPAATARLAALALTGTVLSGSVLSGCAPVQQVIQVPTIEVQSVRLTSLTLPAGIIGTLLGSGSPVANVTMTLRVTNPNPLGMRLANIQSSVIIDGADVGTVDLPNVALPARGSTDQIANLAIPVNLNTAQNFLKVARGQQVTYRLDGKFTADLGLLGLQTFGPFTLSQGQWKQAAIINF